MRQWGVWRNRDGLIIQRIARSKFWKRLCFHVCLFFLFVCFFDRMLCFACQTSDVCGCVWFSSCLIERSSQVHNLAAQLPDDNCDASIGLMCPVCILCIDVVVLTCCLVSYDFNQYFIFFGPRSCSVAKADSCRALRHTHLTCDTSHTSHGICHNMSICMLVSAEFTSSMTTQHAYGWFDFSSRDFLFALPPLQQHRPYYLL